MTFVSEVRARTPSAYFGCGDTSGTAAVDRMGGTSGAYRGEFVLNQTGLAVAETDLAVLLRGSTGFVSIADRTELDLGDRFTIITIVKPTAYLDRSGLGGCIIDCGSQSVIVRFADATGRIIVRRNEVATLMTSTAALPLNVPTFLAIKKNGAELRAFAWKTNITGTVTNSTMVNNALPKGIGAADGGINNFFLGTIDETAFFKEIALSDAELAALADAALNVPLEVASETDDAPGLSVAGATSISIGAATETDNGGTITPSVGGASRALEVATETDTAPAITPQALTQSIAIGVATETDTAPGLSVTSGIGIGVADQTDEAPAITVRPGAVSITIGIATETDTAQALTLSLSQGVALGVATETDNGLEITARLGATTRALEVATEADEAPAIQLDVTYASPFEILSPDFEGDRFLSTIGRSHRAAIRATLLRGVSSQALGAVLDGTVTLDARAATRGRADVTVVDNGTLDLIPTESGDWLVPYGTEIKLERGVYYNEVEIEYAPLGVYRIQDVDVDDKGDTIEIRVTGFDRSQRVIDARFEEPYQIASGVNHGTAILSTIQLIYPEVAYNFATVSTRTTSTIIAEEGSDRWAFCQGIATSLGMELFFDNEGVLILRPVPMVEASSVPAWDIIDGERGVQVNIGRNWTREGSFNRVIATGENMGDGIAPVRGVATDTNPNSPTYYFGPFGRVPRFYQSEFLTTNAQALSAATGILARELGTTQRINFGTIVNPKLVPGNVVLVRRDRIGIREEMHVIDTLTIPLAVSSSMSGGTRATSVT